MGLTNRLKRGLDEVKLVLRGFGARVMIRLRLREEDDFDFEIGPDKTRR